ncbi:MAG TPA: lyase family protein, partial [Chlamydiales bacterium]|nr:lyase family protein [Chlamydiales bacterium]
MSNEEYASPFSTRYCSPEMSRLFSPWFKGASFRKLWIALAVAQKNAGLPITGKQIAQMQLQEDTIDFDRILHHEKIYRHDVMAHIHAFGDVCPEAKPIIHWGATSSYVTDNTDLIQLKKALELLFQKMLHVLQILAVLAEKHAQDPCLGYTHFQPAQPTTIGKRMCLWLQDFLLDARQWHRLVQEIPFLGLKGATGTQSSFLSLLDGDHEKVLAMEQEIAKVFGFSYVVPIAGQTYPRKIDIEVLHSIASFAASAHKFGTDLRLLAHEGEMGETFEKDQVGSSAMPYKRNPIYSERICGLARFAISLAQNPAYTAATQWLERSLDDSSNRRLSIPEAFLSADAILNTMIYVLSALQIDKEASLAQVVKHLPTLCMENILMES